LGEGLHNQKKSGGRDKYTLIGGRGPHLRERVHEARYNNGEGYHKKSIKKVKERCNGKIKEWVTKIVF